MNFRKNIVIVLALFALFLSFTGVAQATFICGVDLNSNGTTADKGELQQCWLTVESTYLCPIQTAGCTATYVPSLCLNGGVFNPATDQCELPGGANCPAGYIYDQTNDICTAPSDCGLGTLDAISDACYQNVQCPQSFTYNAFYGACVKSPLCPTGGSYNGTYDRCEAPMNVTCPTGYTYDKGLFPNNCLGGVACPTPAGTMALQSNTGEYMCLTSSQGYSCPAGTVINMFYHYDAGGNMILEMYCTVNKTYCSPGQYNPVTGNCEATPVTNIPQGYIWDAAMGAYLGDPSCPTGTIYNPVTDICEATPNSYSCPQGFTANAQLTGCELLKCPNGTWITDGATYEKCQASPVSINCPAGFIYSNGYCSHSPICDASATFDAGSHKCIYNAQFGCSPGYTYNTVTGRCESPPVCAAGDIYDPVIDRCVAPNPAVQACPLGNFPCDPATGACVNSYPCSTTFQTQALCSQSCDATCTSACGTDALAAFGDVYWVGQIPNMSWFGITGVTGSGSDLIFYGKDVNANYADIEVGRVTMNGCTFSGTASYFTSGPDNCSSASWGLSGLQATGNLMSFFGGECGQAAGVINISGCYISIPQSTGNFDLTHVVGSGTSLAFYSGFGGNQPVVTVGLCQYSWKCPSCSKTAACSYTCPDPTYTLTPDFRCSKFATCSNGGTLSTQLDVCEEVVTITCPTGYVAVGNQCQKDPTCPTGSTFNAGLNSCVTTTGIICPSRSQIYGNDYVYDPVQAVCFAGMSCPVGSNAGTPYTSNICTAPFAGATCPASSTLNNLTGKCEAQATGFGTLDTALDKFVYYAVQSCPQGWSMVGGLCSGSPACPPLTTWQDVGFSFFGGAVTTCAAAPQQTCPAGYTYGPFTAMNSNFAMGYCQKSSTCQPGDTVMLTAAQYYCVTPDPPTKSCPPNYAYDNITNGCFSAAVCEVGVLDPASNYCQVAGANLCPIGYTLNVPMSRCEIPPSCAQPGLYSNFMDLCTTQASYTCPTGYAFLNGTCYSVPNCPNGTYDPVNKSCFTGIDTCTLGNYPCYTYNGRRLCSQYSCVDQTNPIVIGTGQSKLINPVNDGTVDQTGNCSGQFYILSGEAGECRTVGTQTIFHNCCNSATAMNPLFCDPATDGKVAQKAVQNLCHYVDTYCAESWFGIGCVQSKKVYCCFNSILGRIINEQGRSQLQSFQPNPWGTVMNPKCRGFTPEEFQMLDFSKIDLSEFFTLIQTTATADVQNTATQKIQTFYQNVK